MPEDKSDNSRYQDANGGTPARGEYKGGTPESHDSCMQKRTSILKISISIPIAMKMTLIMLFFQELTGSQSAKICCLISVLKKFAIL